MPAMFTSTLKGTWTRLIAQERLKRSSHVMSVIDQTICVFGGEVQPREPIDNKVDLISIGDASPRLETTSTSPAPTPRVGTASATLNGKIYIFSGRGGVDMAPIEENGAIWAYDPAQSSWSSIKPSETSEAYPPARSYHCSTSDGKNTIFVHAGCPTSGRLSDLWMFNINTCSWTQAPDAPAPQRGGTSIAYSNGKLYRMNGFDGTTEQGGSIDIFDISSNTWSTLDFPADDNAGPTPRSVCPVLPLKVQGRDKLITLFGERDPSSLGHAGAGKMLGDVWLYDIAEQWWTKLETSGRDGTPAPRGWFDADVLKSADGKESVVVHGGLGEDNERLDDLWVLSF